MLRAGPFSDERIVGLANRRFVPFYFDLAGAGFAGDAKAREFVVSERPKLGGARVPTPPLLFMTPTGEVVGEVSNYASTEEVLAKMRAVLKEHPRFDAPSAAEQAAEGLELARIRIDLLDYDGARKVLAAIDGPEAPAAKYLLGHLARLDGDWEAMDRHFAKVDAEELADDVWIERAWRRWHTAEFEALAKDLEPFPRSSNRFSEARYLYGLARYHQGEKKEAIASWKTMIGACSEDPWVYRADWACDNAGREGGKKGRVVFASGGKKTPLGRIGYMGRRNPDLDGPSGP